MINKDRAEKNGFKKNSAADEGASGEGQGEKKVRHRAEHLRQISVMTTIPALLLAGPVVGYLIGSYLDRLIGTEPWLVIVFIFLGMAASVRNLIDMISRTKGK